MLRDAVRGVVVVASEFAEETGKRVLGMAEDLLARTGVDVAEVERRIAEQFPPTSRSLQTLAEEAVTAGRAGIDLAVGVARSEVERVFEKVGDQVTKVGVVLSFLESKLREVEEEKPPAQRTEPRAEGLFDAGWDAEHPAEPAAAPEAAAEPAGEAVTEVPARKAAARRASPSKAAASKAAPSKAPADGGAAEPVPRKRAARKAPAGQAPVKKTTARKTVARKTAASGAAAEPAAGKKAAAKKTVVRKTATAKAAEQRKASDD